MKNRLNGRRSGVHQRENDNTDMSVRLQNQMYMTRYQLVVVQPRQKSRLQTFVDQLLHSRGFSTNRISGLLSSYRLIPTVYQKACYGKHIAHIVRAKENVNDLTSLLAVGISPNPYDYKTREFLIHTVCNNGNYAALQVMLEYGGSEIVHCIDALHRTPLHSVCMNSKRSISSEQFKIVKDLLICDPLMINIPDCWGCVPLLDVPEEQYSDWMRFFDANKDEIWPLTSNTLPNRFSENNHICLPQELTLEVAEMLSSGRLTTREIYLFQYDEEVAARNSIEQDDDDDDEEEVENFYALSPLFTCDLKHSNTLNGIFDTTDPNSEHNLCLTSISELDHYSEPSSDWDHDILFEELVEILDCISATTISKIQTRMELTTN
jgi:ankyrin repeat protein